MLLEEMSPAETCLVLGAGTSKPYGYWLGSELKNEILRYWSGANGAVGAWATPILPLDLGFRLVHDSTHA
jgi:hypothetical protein